MDNENVVKVQKHQVIAKQKDKVRKWYIILEGNVVQRNSYARIMLGKNSIIGISDAERYLCDYIASDDCVLAAFACESAEDMVKMIHGEISKRSTLLRAVLHQRQTLLKTYSGFYHMARQFHSFVEQQYSDYTAQCAKYQLESNTFSRIENFKPLEIEHRAENWEISNSNSLTGQYLEEYVSLMQKEDSLCIGTIMEISYQTRRIVKGIIEMTEYLRYNRDILLSESGNDLLALYYGLELRIKKKNLDVTPITEMMDRMLEVIKKLGIYEEALITSRVDAYQKQALSSSEEEDSEKKESWEEEEPVAENCLLHILTYANYAQKDIDEMCAMVTQYKELPDMLSTDAEVSKLRKRMTQVFYDVYYKVFMRAMKEQEELSPILEMFLNFGFMDVQLVGEENANILYDLTEHLDVCSSDNVFTIYAWLKSIYEGVNEPSKNEFDLDYIGYLNELKKTGKLRADQVKAYTENVEMKVKYEIQNMFASGNRITYGKISTFCPLLAEHDLINSIDKMLVTVQKLEESLDKLRKIDYSAFYRETMFSDPDKGINREMIMKEVMPNIILMPNAGTRAQMWQETAGIRRDTPARFMFPIFTSVDLDDMMVDTVGRYRWEICRKIQGVHWNDIREKSLTAEYCDYMQFYKKNHELSPETKEKIKLALIRGRNNYREVFVKDYQNWIKYESRGSFRLNKIAREILISYCPFAKPIRQSLKANPMYESGLHRMDIQNAKKVQRIHGVYDKYLKAGGKITQELQDNLDFYDM
ncbi:MAG: cyclic nucleotide-binding domain-containing protein [Roseburia sp.]